jgi:ATP-binding cassette subfamily B multidrug efflux pump
MLKLLKKLKKKDFILIFISLFIITLSVYLELELPTYTKELTRLIQLADSQIEDILLTGGKMLLFALGGTICTIISGYISAYVSADLSYNVREDLFNHIMDLDEVEMKTMSTSTLITRTTNDITQIQMVMSMGLTMMFKAPLMAIWGTIKVMHTSWQFSVATAVAVVVMVSVILLIMSLVLPRFKKVQKLTDDMNRIARENLTGIKVVRAFNAEKFEEEKFDQKNDELIDIQLFNRSLFSLMMPLMTLIMSGISLAVYWIGAYLLNAADLLNKGDVLGDIVAFGSYGIMIIQAFMLLTMIFMMIPRAEVSAKRINEVLAIPVQIKEGKEEKEAELKGDVEFNNVSFHFLEGENVLNDISFHVKKGETLAIIGATGSGKSTIVNLVTRLLEATQGEIKIDGQDIRSYSFDTLYQKIGFVQQKAVLFSDSVRNNLLFGLKNQEKTDDELWEALDIAQAKSFVGNLPNQLDAPIAEGGTNLSGGQKQRLSIARALVRKPEILIFDDSFSALDYKTDKELRKQIVTQLKGTTCIIVAQRIGTIRNADQILVLDDGQIVGHGKHEELLKTCSVYQEIALSQLSKEELEKGGDAYATHETKNE